MTEYILVRLYSMIRGLSFVYVQFESLSFWRYVQNMGILSEYSSIEGFFHKCIYLHIIVLQDAMT